MAMCAWPDTLLAIVVFFGLWCCLSLTVQVYFTLVLAVPECCNINNNTKLLTVQHTYIYCTYIVYGQHVSTYHKVNTDHTKPALIVFLISYFI